MSTLIKSGYLFLSDPSFSNDMGFFQLKLKVKKGKWIAFVYVDDRYKDRISGIEMIWEDEKGGVDRDIVDSYKYEEKVDSVGIDGTHVAICDFVVYPMDGITEEEFVKRAQNEDDLILFVETGFGAGLYDVKVEKDSQGEIHGVYIDTINDEIIEKWENVIRREEMSYGTSDSENSE